MVELYNRAPTPATPMKEGPQNPGVQLPSNPSPLSTSHPHAQTVKQ